MNDVMLKPGWYLQHEADQYYLYDAHHRRYRRLGPALLAAIRLCDGTRTLDAIGAELARTTSAAAAHKLISALLSAGCLTSEQVQRSPVAPAASLYEGISGSIAVRLPGRRSPFVLQFDPGLNCIQEDREADVDPYRDQGKPAGLRARAAAAHYGQFINTLFGGDSPVTNSQQLAAVREVIECLPQAPAAGSKLALDAGCGSGHLTTALRQAGWEPCLYDLEVSHVDEDTWAVAGDVCSLPFATGTFGLICSLFVLEHTADPFAAIQEMVRVCTRGGQIVIAVPGFSCGEYVTSRFVRRSTLHWEHLWGFGLAHTRAPFVIDIREVARQLRSSGCSVQCIGLSAARGSRQRGRLIRTWDLLRMRLPVVRWLGEVLLIKAVKTQDGDLERSDPADVPSRSGISAVATASIREFFLELGIVLGRNSTIDRSDLPRSLALGAALDLLFGGLAHHRVRVHASGVTITMVDCRLQPRADICAAHRGCSEGFIKWWTKLPKIDVVCGRCSDENPCY